MAETLHGALHGYSQPYAGPQAAPVNMSDGPSESASRWGAGSLMVEATMLQRLGRVLGHCEAQMLQMQQQKAQVASECEKLARSILQVRSDQELIVRDTISSATEMQPLGCIPASAVRGRFPSVLDVSQTDVSMLDEVAMSQLRLGTAATNTALPPLAAAPSSGSSPTRKLSFADREAAQSETPRFFWLPPAPEPPTRHADAATDLGSPTAPLATCEADLIRRRESAARCQLGTDCS